MATSRLTFDRIWMEALLEVVQGAREAGVSPWEHREELYDGQWDGAYDLLERCLKEALAVDLPPWDLADLRSEIEAISSMLENGVCHCGGHY